MRDSVAASFETFSHDLEGRTAYLYLDSAEPRGFVTIGVGNLCPLSFALTLPFVWPDGRAATRAEITAAWIKVDERQDLKKHGGGIFAGLQGNEIRLPKLAIDAMVERKLVQTDQVLASMFPAWPSWPACAQLALISWAWAVGPHSRYPRMHECLHGRDFAMASTECDVNPKRGTIVTRNMRNRILLLNAARVEAYKLDPDMLEWTHLLGVADADTLPALPNAETPLPLLNTPIAQTSPASYPTVHVGADMYRLDREPPDDPDDAA